MRKNPTQKPISMLKVPAWNDIYLSAEKYQELAAHIADYDYDPIPISPQDEVLHRALIFKTLQKMHQNDPGFMVDVYVDGKGRNPSDQVWGSVVDSLKYDFHVRNSLSGPIYMAIKFGELEKVYPRAKYSKPKKGATVPTFSVQMAQEFQKDSGTISGYVKIYGGLTSIDRTLLTNFLPVLGDLYYDTLSEITERTMVLDPNAKVILAQALSDASQEKQRYQKGGLNERTIRRKVNEDLLRSISNQLKQAKTKALLPTQNDPALYMTTTNGKLSGDAFKKMDDLLQSLKGFMRTRNDGNNPVFIPEIIRMRLSLDNFASRINFVVPDVQELGLSVTNQNGKKIKLKKEAWKTWE